MHTHVCVAVKAKHNDGNGVQRFEVEVEEVHTCEKGMGMCKLVPMCVYVCVCVCVCVSECVCVYVCVCV